MAWHTRLENNKLLNPFELTKYLTKIKV